MGLTSPNKTRLLLFILISLFSASISAVSKDDNPTINRRRCNKVFIRADVGNVGVAPPTEDDSSSGNKTNVGEVVGLSFLLVFVILVFFVCICWHRMSASDEGLHRQQVVVQPPVRVVENPQQVEIVQPPPPPPPREQPLPARPPSPRNGVLRRKEEKQPQPPPPHRDDIPGQREVQPPQRQPQPPLPRDPRDEIIRPRKEKQPPAPPPDGVPGRKEGKQPQPQPPPPREEVQRRKEGKKERQEPPEDEERRRKRVREGKQPQQQQQKSRDEEVIERQKKKGRDGNQTHEVAKEDENSLGLPKKYTFDELKIMTNEFHLENKIGEGTFGNVYKGTLSDGTTMVAVKCLKFGVGQNDFKNEVEALGRTDHPNLVKLIGYCAESLLRVLVYEYMINGSLEKWIFHASSRRLLTWPEMKNIIEGIAKGLLHLHDECRDKKILHRDLKPSNVVLDENKNAKLCDFGFAKLLDKDQNSTSTGYAGTPAYMAPEVKKKKRISDKIDVYSFGILVLEVLFGKRYCYLVLPGHKRVEENQLPHLINKNLSVETRKKSKEIEKIGKLAVWCIHKKPENRPRMSVVVAALHYLNAKFSVPGA